MAIQVLPTHLVNKIAAGEVIERPASIVKELVENALDAGAGRIDVTIADGGRRLISVTDDGCGMGPDDAELVFAPHATSKLAAEDDLFNIDTLGFRGEALASIASISHAHVRTRRREDDGGCEISASGPNVEPVRPCAGAVGTTVTVRDLFFNTPARRKFMKAANTEAGHVSEQMSRLAIPHPQIAFTLTHNGRKTLDLPASDSTRRRIGGLFMPDLADALLTVAPRSGDVAVSGLIAPPAGGRSSGKWQYFFLNGRYIRDRLLAHALRESYRGLIDPNRFPVAFVFIVIDPAEVDVNVHPTKIEVRFRNGQAVHGQLTAALKDTLNKADLSPVASFDASGDMPTGNDARRDSMRKALADFFKSNSPPQQRLDFPQRNPVQNTVEPFSQNDSSAVVRRTTFPASPDAPPVEESRSYIPTTSPCDAPAPVAMPTMSAPSGPAAMQIHNSYIVVACDDGLEIIDQHALHERLIYNDLLRRLADDGSRGLTGQRMLIPETFSVTDAEADLLESHRELLGRLGIEAEPFGPQTWAIQQFPLLLARRSVAAGEFIQELLDKLGDDETTDPERLLSDVLDMMACKAAVKAGDPLTDQEMAAMLVRRQQADKSSSCPHGRPTSLKLSMADLAKQFKRT